MRVQLILVALVTLCAAYVFGRQIYQTRIPNGAGVPNHPGVGHIASAGGGPRNAFGMAFSGAGLMWTTALCVADSDGDGQSNGLELGDPCCEWAEGSTPNATTGISDPSIASSKTTRTACTDAPTAASGATVSLSAMAACAFAVVTMASRV